MRKLIPILLLIFVGAGLMQTGSDNWKADSVSQLGNAGISVFFPDGAFLGEDTLTGYQGAVLLEDVLRTLE